MPPETDLLDAPGQPLVPTEPTPPPDAGEGAAAAAPDEGQPAAKPADKKAPKPTAENLSNLNDLMGEFVENAGLEKRRKKKEDADKAGQTAAAAQPAAGGEADASAAGRGTPRKPARATGRPAVAPPAATPPSMTPEQIARLSAETAAAVVKANAPQAAHAPAVPDLEPEEAHKFEVYQHLETMDPKYKGIADRFKTLQLASYKYQEKWESEHPNEEFDPESQEHDAWKKSAGFDAFEEPTVALGEAEIDMAVERKLAARAKARGSKEDERIANLERAEGIRAAQPAIAKHVIAGGQTFWKKQGKEFEDIIGANGAVNNDKLKKIYDADEAQLDAQIAQNPGLRKAIRSGAVKIQTPTEHRVFAARQLNGEAQEIYTIMNGLRDIDPASPVHRDIVTFGAQLEERLMSEPPENQRDAHGRAFVPTGKYAAMKPEERAAHWTLTPEWVIPARVQFWAETVAENIAAEQAKLTKFGVAAPVGRTAAAAAAVARPSLQSGYEDDDDDGKPHSPSAVAQSKTAGARGGSAPAPRDPLSAFLAEDF